MQHTIPTETRPHPQQFGGVDLIGTHQRELHSYRLCSWAYAQPFVPREEWWAGPYEDVVRFNHGTQGVAGALAGMTQLVTSHEVRGRDHHCRRQMAQVEVDGEGVTRPLMCSGSELPEQPFPGARAYRGLLRVATRTEVVGPNGFPLIEGMAYAVIPVQQPVQMELVWSAGF